MVRQNGSIRFIHGKGRVIERDSNGDPLRMIGVIADETESRKIEAQSKLMEHALSSAFEGLALVDLKGNFLFTNAVFEAMFGYGPGELFGRPVSIINAGSDADKSEVHASILLALNQNAAWTGIISNRKKDGSIIVTEARVNKFVHPMYGEVWANLQWVVDSNAGQHRRKQWQLRWDRSVVQRAAQLNRSIIENSNDAIISKTIDGTITGWNSMAEAIFGYSAIEMIGQRILCLFPADRVAEEDLLIRRIVGGQQVSHFETVRLKKDGSQIEVSVSLSPILDDSGAIVGISKIVRDITEQKRVERTIKELSEQVSVLLQEKTERLAVAEHSLLAQAEEMNRILRELGTFERRQIEAERKRLALELHDDVGQMLTAVGLHLQVVRKRVSEESLVTHIASAMKLNSAIVSSLRRILEGLRPAILDEFGLVAVIKSQLAGIRHISTLKTQLVEDLGQMRLPSDVELNCLRVVQEAISNTVKHSRATNLFVEVKMSRNVLKISLKDDGIGFDPQEALSQRSRTHYGLSGMQARVTSLGGNWELESAIGSGCNIVATIPVPSKEAT
jgi:two-component system sensor histidine kinase UhpB